MACIIRHTGLVVNDIDQSIEFYEDVFGFKLLKRMVDGSGYIQKLTGVSGAIVEWAKLTDGGSGVLELLEYKKPHQKKVDIIYDADMHGCSHIAITVESIDQVYHALTDRGLFCNSKPLVSPDGKVKVMYVRDYDGIIIELVEEISCL
ncbi:Lactoylglutathione lyase [Candidatus Desulfarcum epimagneticum]|uniref:Lactoylglutathione lyase n=1 Tax=uncultured Desulfobacteraceae bacterium TaxID=218296 RepID=A0A484HNJ8_9BACT|nr:Lactoylglutathione lyase [uncultured Desulfobacteraceae bacterium]